MADQPDVEALARRLMDLWQDQLSGLPDDPGFRDTLASLCGGSAGLSDADRLDSMPIGAGPWAFWSLVPALIQAASAAGGDDRPEGARGRGSNGSSEAGGGPGNGGATAAGPAAAAAASDRRDQRLEQLEARLGALEHRVEQLAAGLEAGGRSAARKPGRSRS